MNYLGSNSKNFDLTNFYHVVAKSKLCLLTTSGLPLHLCFHTSKAWVYYIPNKKLKHTAL